MNAKDFFEIHCGAINGVLTISHEKMFEMMESYALIKTKGGESRKWIKIEKRVPSHDNIVQILYNNGSVSGGEYCEGNWYDCSEEGFVKQLATNKVIAWQPLARGMNF